MSLTSKLRSAGLWQFLQIVIQVISQFGYMAIMARLLSKADFGLMALAGSFIAFGALFGESGMGSALIQRQKITQKHINAALQGSIVMGLVIFLVFFIFAKSISIFFSQPTLEPIIKVVGITVILGSISVVSRSLLQKRFLFKQTSLITMSSSIIGYSAGAILAFNNWGVWSLVAATVIRSIVDMVLLLYLAPFKFSTKMYYKEWKELFSFGSGIILLRINNYLSNQGLMLILGKIFYPAQLGVFERTNQIRLLPGSYLGNVLDTIMFPAMAEIQDKEEKLFRIYQHGLGVVNTVLMPIAIFLIFFSKEVVLILLGSKWLEAILPLQIMLIVLPFSSSGRMADSVVRAKGLIYKNVIRKFIYVIVLLTTVSIGAYFYGIVGASISVTFSYLFNYLIMLILVKSIFKKSAKEIFMRPILSGIKLSVIVLILIFIFTAVFDSWQHDSIVKFILISICIGIMMSIMAWKRPHLLGVYLEESLKKILSKSKSQ